MPDAAPRESAGRDLASLRQALDQFVREEQRATQPAKARVAVLIPCFNEEAAVAQVVADFRASLPDAAIFVYDNNSTDGGQGLVNVKSLAEGVDGEGKAYNSDDY